MTDEPPKAPPPRRLVCRMPMSAMPPAMLAKIKKAEQAAKEGKNVADSRGRDSSRRG